MTQKSKKVKKSKNTKNRVFQGYVENDHFRVFKVDPEETHIAWGGGPIQNGLYTPKNTKNAIFDENQ